MGKRTSHADVYAVQEFCYNHNITTTSAKELGQMIGMSFQVMGRILSSLGWSKHRPRYGDPYLRVKNGAHKDFRANSRRMGKIILRRFEKHYEQTTALIH